MMQTVLLYAFAAAVLGGMDSPIGAVVGGLLLGVLLNLVGTYVALGRRRAAARRRARRDPRRAARAPGGPLRPRGGEARMRAQARSPFGVGVRRARRAAVRALGVPDGAARDRRRVLHRDPRARRPHRAQRPDLARPRRVHGGRRVHDGDPDGEPRRARPLDDPDRRPRSPAAIGLLAGVPALRLSGLYLALATFGIAIVAADDPEEVRPLHRRLDRDHALRQADADRARRRREGARRAADEQPVALRADVDGRRRAVPASRGGCSTRASAVRCARCATASSRRRPSGVNRVGVQGRRVRGLGRVRGRRGRAASRSTSRTSAPTRSRSSSRSTCSSARSSASSARSGAQCSARC